jgi:fused signal recognition particle receptor
VLAIEEDLGLPVKLVGLGEGIDDLNVFDPKAYLDALFAGVLEAPGAATSGATKPGAPNPRARKPGPAKK